MFLFGQIDRKIRNRSDRLAPIKADTGRSRYTVIEDRIEPRVNCSQN